MNTPHTPGPWTTNNDCQIQCPALNTYGNFIVASINRENTPEDHANARLIAAAPALLDALEAFIALADEGNATGDEELAVLQAAKAVVKAVKEPLANRPA